MSTELKARSIPLGTSVYYGKQLCYVVARHIQIDNGSAYIALGTTTKVGSWSTKKQMEIWGYPGPSKWKDFDKATWDKCSFFQHIYGIEVLKLATHIVGQKCALCSSRLEHKEFAANQRIYCDFCKVLYEIE